MFSFLRRRKENIVLNLYLIVDVDGARRFDGLEIIRTALRGLGLSAAVQPQKYCANFTKEWRTWDSFVSGVIGLPALTYADVSFATNGYALHYSNSLVNFSEPPELGSVHLGISIPEAANSLEHVLSLAKTLCRSAPFEYGYVSSLAGNVLQFTEQKIKKGIAGSSVRVDRRSTIWEYHLAAVRSGFLRSVYPVNLINKSHLENVSIGRLLQSAIGEVKPFVGDLSIWRLSESDHRTALEALAESGSLIWHESGVENFLAQPQAREVNVRMSPASIEIR